MTFFSQHIIKKLRLIAHDRCATSTSHFHSLLFHPNCDWQVRKGGTDARVYISPEKTHNFPHFHLETLSLLSQLRRDLCHHQKKERKRKRGIHKNQGAGGSVRITLSSSPVHRNFSPKNVKESRVIDVYSTYNDAMSPSLSALQLQWT
jgi:hypothetical protein